MVTYLSKFFNFLLSSSRCLNFIRRFRRASMLWFVLTWPVRCGAAMSAAGPLPALLAAVFIELAPPISLFIRVESMVSSVTTAAKITFLIRFSSVVKVKSASFELFNKFWHLYFSSMLVSTFRRVKLAKLGLFILTPISKFGAPAPSRESA